MNPSNSPQSSFRRVLTARRLTLMASVAAVGAALLLAGPGGYGSNTQLGTPSAAAAESTSARPAGFADLVVKVKPAVISVQVKIDAAAAQPTAMQRNNDDDNTPFDQFSQKFGRQFGQDGRNGRNAPQRHETLTGEGSGFFITADGYAVTNNHVVDHAKSVQVTTDDGTIYTAKVVGTDSKTDLALIKVDGKNDFPFVKFADHAPRVGDWVVAVGNPFGLGGTVTAGIVSARGRDIGSGPYDDYIQIDAPINKGNSGGPAFDIEGNVIGINTAIFSPSGGSVGIGFDIPADTAQRVIAELKANGHVTRGWLGVQIQPVTPSIANSLGLKKAEGAIVDEPQANSPAAKAGIESGDVITAVNGTPVKDARDLARTIGMLAPNSTVKLDVLRDGQQKAISLTIGTMPNERQAKADTPSRADSQAGVPRLGLSVAPASEVAGAGGKGVVVTAVDPNGPAAERGVEVGNVILAVGGKPVASVEDLRNALRDAKAQGKQDVLVRVKRGDATGFIALPLGNA
jgi:serine protease Do